MPQPAASVLEELKRHEPIFHNALFGSTLDDYARRMDEHYWEVGASGRCYSRAVVLEHLRTRLPDPHEANWVVSDATCREIAADNYLFTYTLHQGARITRRCTWWRRTLEGWKILYHQGTLAAGA
jgi:hypothetical protein